MVTCRDFGSKLVGRIDRRVHVPAESFLGDAEGIHDVLEWRVAHHEKIDIARRAELAACRGPEHECNLNAIVKLCESLSEEIDEPGRLREQPAQLRKNGRVAVSLEVHLAALNCAPQKPRRSQQLQLTLHRPYGAPCVPGDLTQVIRLVCVTEQPPKHTTTSTAEK